MGKHIERVPPEFVHPAGPDGQPEPGAHVGLLRGVTDAACSAYQVYEDVSAGTPISPIFRTEDDLRQWLLAEGYSPHAVDNFIIVGAAASFFFKDGRPVDGIEALALLTREAALEIRATRRTSVRRPG